MAAEPTIQKLFDEVEMPLVSVLARMEANGVTLDVRLLKKMAQAVSDELDTLTDKIHALAGQPFNIDSPRQLSEIHIDEDEIVLVWMDSGTLVRVGRGGFEERIRKFRAVYPSLREQGGLPDQIDLRFDRQVVVR